MRNSWHGIERLEARRLLAAEVIISELAANGQAALVDEDADRSDWIELHNAGDELANLDGWYLTDDAENPKAWRFPDVSIAPGAYLVVFASGKDRAEPAEPLHTAFRLADQGEYLALVRPDGETISYSFGESFPAQLPGATFGSLQSETLTTISQFGADHRYFVADPTAPRSLSRGWADLDFDDSEWLEGQGSVGFDTTNQIDELIGTDVETLMHDRNASIYVRKRLNVEPDTNASALRLRMRYDDGYVVFLNGDVIASRNVSGRRQSNQSTSSAERDGAPSDVETLYFLLPEIELQPGENVLAIHGLNVDESDTDFLISAEASLVSAGEIDEAGALGFFASPSPGRPNGLDTVAGQLPPIAIDLPHGFYEGPQEVTLSSTVEGASLVYTTDGSLPRPNSANVVGPDDGPPSVTLEVDSVMTLRASAYKSGWLPSSVQTASYLFLDDIVRQSADGSAPAGWPEGPVKSQLFAYGMDPDIVDSEQYGPLMFDALTQIPSVSLVTDQQHLFDKDTGIYVNGLTSRAGNNEASWERPTSIELIYPDGSEGFQIDAGLRLRGGAGRDPHNAKHSFRLFFRSMYGESKLTFPLFGDEGADQFDKIDFRAPSVPSWSFCWEGRNTFCPEHTIIRDVFGRDTQRDMGQPYTRSRYYHLYLNGQYWGVYQSQERADASYGATYFGGSPDDYDVIKVESFPHGTAATHGTQDAWRALWDAAVAGFEDDADYRRVQGKNPDGTRNPDYEVLLDVDNLIDYLVTIFYNGDRDGPITDWGNNVITNNWFGIRNRNGEEGFKFFIHDGEWALHNVNQNRLGPWPAGETYDQSNPQWIHQQLMANENYRIRFADRAYRHLSEGGALSPERAQQRIDARAAEFDLAIIGESARWGDTWRSRPYTKVDWERAVDRIRNSYIPQRREILIDQFLNATLDAAGQIPAPLYLEIPPPQLSHTGGPVPLGTPVTLDADDTIFITLDGSDPRSGREEVAWESMVRPDSAVRYFVPRDDSLEALWNQVDFDDTAWNLGTNGIGFGSRIADLISTDVEDVMRGTQSSLYTRFTFELDRPDHFDRFRLNLQYDDGAVVYINGVEVSRNFLRESEVQWDSTAGRRTGSPRIEDLDLTEFQSLLRPGKNVLAVQGLNTRATDSDFLLAPQLLVGVAVELGINPDAIQHREPIVIDRNLSVTARAYRSGNWSPVIEAVFDTGAVPLRIDELMFHPLDPTEKEAALGYRDEDDFEYIEFVNLSEALTLDLTGYQIQGGIEFTFPSIALPPGHRTVVVRRADAFTERYGDGPRIAGEYMHIDGSNRLSNGGESLRVLDPLGLVVQELTYDDDWQSDADGGGHSLQVIDVTLPDLSIWSESSGWRSSRARHGSPGIPDRVTGDANGDGVFNSSDLVQVFVANEFEDEIPLNSIFDDGDWNGDGDFTTADLVAAFQAGTYQVAGAPQARVAAALEQMFADEDAKRRGIKAASQATQATRRSEKENIIGGFSTIPDWRD